MRKITFSFSLLLSFICLTTIAAEAQTKNPANAAYMGVGSCSSSNCHGGADPRAGSDVLQNEYVTWTQFDQHSRAWSHLTTEESKKIAVNLGIGSPEKEPLCLRCHSTYFDEHGRKAANFQVEDGVGCETCHGAAENYLGSHTANDATHERNVQAGMIDVVAPDKRAKLCTTCHFGGEDKAVTHRLIGAGHPRLAFELDTFSMIQPAHWLVDEDYRKRKGDYSSVKSWLSGQVELSQRILSRMQSEKMSKAGVWPELTLFNCYACHHSLEEDQWKDRDYHGRPGELLLNVSSIVIVSEAMRVLKPALADSMAARLANLSASYQKGSLEDVKALVALTKDAAGVIGQGSYNEATANKLLRQLVDFGASVPYLQYETAEQVAMGISSLIALKSPDGSLYRSEIERMYEALKNQEAFKPQEFTNALKLFKL